MKKFLCIIPARSGSKGIRHKNIKRLNGIPLLGWTIKDCLKIKEFDKVIVSTDSEKYAKIALSFGADVPFLRSKKNSRDKSEDIDFLKEIYSFYENKNFLYDYFVHMRPTTPLRKIPTMKKILNYFKRNIKRYDSLRSVQKMHESSYKSFLIDNKNTLKPIFKTKKKLDYFNKPRQYFPDTFFPNGYMDIYKTENFTKKSLYGSLTAAYVTEDVVEIDNLDNFSQLKYLFKKKYAN
jgi:CMP-N,N'-diacetyllegionaminic acid synthase